MLKKYREILTYFLKFQFQEIPVLKNNCLNYLLYKKNLSKYQSNLELIEKKIDLDEILKIFTPLTPEIKTLYWQQLIKKNKNDISKLPVLFLEKEFLKIKLISLNSFISENKEITQLSDYNFYEIFSLSNFPFLVINNHGQLIYKNNSFAKLEKNTIFKKNKTSQEFFLEQLPKIKNSLKTKNTSFYKIPINGDNLIFKVQKLLLSSSIVFVFFFIKK